jgi:predicted permease
MLTIKDFKTAFNSLLKAKGYVVTVVLTLGITLGALVAMFNLNYQLLAKPLPYPDQERLYIAVPSIYHNGQLKTSGSVPYPALVEAYKSKDEYVEQKALVKQGLNIIRSLPDTPQVRIGYVTPEYLSLLQVPMILGRSFSLDEGLYSNSPVVVLSFETWQKIYNQDPDIVGKTLQVGEVSFKVIGVIAKEFLAPQFDGVGLPTELWLPWDYSVLDEYTRQHWGQFKGGQHIVGKLKLGQSPEIVSQALSTNLNTRFQEWIAAQDISGVEVSIGFALKSYQQAILGDVKGRILLLFAGALALVFIAAVNITNLMLARVSNQQRNMAIQAAMGAQKSHLFSGLLAEILWLILLVMVLALAVSLVGVELLKNFANEQLPRVAELHLSWQSLVFTLATGLSLALIFAFLVSRQINYRALNQLLQTSGKGTGVQISVKVRALLILSQVMFTAILLTASLQILFQSLQHIRQPLGFAEDDIYRVSLNVSSQTQWPITQQQKNTLVAMRSHLLTHPKIAGVSLASSAPLYNGLTDFLSREPDYKKLEQNLSTFIDQDYLSLFGFEFIAGRNFTADDFRQGTHTIIINETLARKLQADGKVLNHRFYWRNGGSGGELNEVVGIVRDLSLPGAPEQSRMFMPFIAPFNETELIVKLKPQQTMTKQEMNELLGQVDPRFKVAAMHSMPELHNELIAQAILTASLTAALTLLALSLAAIGVYGVLSYSVQLRRFELGIRMAVGARPNIIFLKVLKDNIAPVIFGLLVAAAGLVGLWLWMQQTNYNMETSVLGWLLPPMLILSLTAATSLLSVWQIIRKPASEVLRGD